MSDFVILVSERGGAEKRLSFSGAEVVIGRVQGNEVVLPKGNVSKRHARISREDENYVVSDLNSTNGTYVNRRRISQPTLVRSGDNIYIGDFVIRIDEPSRYHHNAESHVGELLSTSPDLSDQNQKTPASALEMPVAGESRPGASDPSNPLVVTGEHAPVSLEDGTALYGPDAPALLKELVEEVHARYRQALEGGGAGGTFRSLSSLLEDQWATSARAQASDSAIRESLMALAAEEIDGAGRFAQILSDSSVSQIVVSGEDSVVVWRGERRRSELPFASLASLQRCLRRLCERSGVPNISGQLTVEAELGEGLYLSAVSHRTNAGGVTVRVWRQNHERTSLDSLVREGVLSRVMATFLRQMVTHRANIVVVGERAGVQRLVTALAAAVEAQHCVVVHSGSTLCAERYDATRLYSHAPLLAESVEHLARGATARLIVEHLNPATYAAFFRGIAGGMEGIVCGAYARSMATWWRRVAPEMAIELGHHSANAAREWLVGNTDIFIEVARLDDDRCRVVNIVEISRDPDAIDAFEGIFTFAAERTAKGGEVEGTFRATGHVPAFVTELRSRGTNFDSTLFHTAVSGRQAS